MPAWRLQGGILIPGQVPAELIRAAEKPNPARESWEKRAKRHAQGQGGYPGPCPPRTIACMGEVIPGWSWLPRWLPGAREGVEVEDRRVAPVCDPLTLQGLVLRTYQAAALDAWEDGGREGVIVAPCGAGKTAIGIAAIAAVSTPTLVLVHTAELQAQWVERIRTGLGVEPRTIGGPRKSPKTADPRVCVAMLQSLARLEWLELAALGRGYGLVILDEAHHAPAVTWSRILAALPSRWRLALTATPDRPDGLGDWLLWSCGPIRATIALDELEDAGSVVRPEIRTVRTGWAPQEEPGSWAEIGAAIAYDPDRNGLLCAEVVGLLHAGHQLVLVLVDRVEHAHILAARMGGCALTGDMADVDRRAVLDLARCGAVRVVCATSLADEGLDLPSIDAVVLGAPTKHPGRLQQRIGRALRPSPGKLPPVVVDLVDAWGPLQGWARIRRETYARLGWA